MSIKSNSPVSGGLKIEMKKANEKLIPSIDWHIVRLSSSLMDESSGRGNNQSIQAVHLMGLH